jgi:hypothetical protein
MGRMRPVLLATLALCVAAAAAPEEDRLTFGKKPYVVRPLEFTVRLPDGWQAQQDRTGMVAQVARDPKGMGFLISREPMLHEPKEFEEQWQLTLKGAGIDTNVKKSRAGKHSGWRAKWETDAADGRVIEVHRIHVEDNEMLYNFSFTAPKGEEHEDDFERLVDGVLRSFEFTGEKPELEFNRTAEPIGTRSSLTLPKGYAKPEPKGGIRGFPSRGHVWVKMLEGYVPPHEAGRIELGNVMQDLQEDDAAEAVLAADEAKYGKPQRRPRGRKMRYNDMKGYQLTAEFVTEQGVPKLYFVFVIRPRRSYPVYLKMLVDEREERLYKDLFKEFCKRAKLGE